jgi:hypothetical protein
MGSYTKRSTCRLFIEALEDRLVPSSGATNQQSLLGQLTPTPTRSVSTVPANGDVNPYGVAFVPAGFPTGGPLHTGDILVANFNNSSNLQGTGSTIVDITPSGNQSVFFQAQSQLGLTTALGVLRAGFVIVGSVPTTDGSFNTIQQGSLLILDSQGNQVLNLTSATRLDGPWDLTVLDGGAEAAVFVSDVLSGTVTRIDLGLHGSTPVVQSMTQIASGYTHRGDPAALAIGPTGLALDTQRDILYVASTGDNAIYAIPNAAITMTDHGTGRLIYQDTRHLHGPLGLVLAPNGDLITSNGDAVNPNLKHSSELVEFTPSGRFVAQFQVDPSAGAAFGLAVTENNNAIRFAAVDDATNMLGIWRINNSNDPNAVVTASSTGNSSASNGGSALGSPGTTQADLDQFFGSNGPTGGVFVGG